MSTFRWLHLSDLHIGLPGQNVYWPNVRDVFLSDLEKLHKTAGPWDAIFLTGDLVQSGKEDEFNQLEDGVLNQLKEKLSELGSGSAVFLSVPGNHDLVRPDSKRLTAAERQLVRANGFPEIAKEFWESGENEYRQVISRAFGNFAAWASKQQINPRVSVKDGLLPGDVVCTIVLNASTDQILRIGVAGINTSFLQLAAGDYKGKLTLDQAQLHAACGGDLPGWINSHDACILLSHHGPDWLNQETQNQMYPELNPAGRFAVHLHGHMHENVQSSTATGGGKLIRRSQAASLFGLAEFGDSPNTQPRIHGYSAGCIDFSNSEPTIRFWPRIAYFDANGWRFERDSQRFVLEDDGGTRPDKIDDRSGKSKRISLPRKTIQKGNQARGIPTNEIESLQNRYGTPIVDESIIRHYFEAVRNANSHIRFVDIPHLTDVSDVELSKLYVKPRFSATEIRPDIPPEMWPACFDALSVLRESNAVVLLGDPGSGKSTLVSFLAWQMCLPISSAISDLGISNRRLIPLPMILRELRLKADLTWESLLEEFATHRIGKLLGGRKTIEAILKDGCALVLLDGLDEIGNLAIRQKLRDAVHVGMGANPDCKWILTSRTIGYGLVKFHTKVEEVATVTNSSLDAADPRSRTRKTEEYMADLFYLAPFDDGQIEKFAMNWYVQHEREPDIVSTAAQQFVSAIKENDGTQRLARIPYLLTLMAIIHRKHATLPHGRTDLYGRIATAYLESIDLRRQLDQLPYSLAQKKRWLAEIAYRMQLKRSKNMSPSPHGDILAKKTDVETWLRKAMGESAAINTKVEALSLIDYFAQRSGLLIPRGEGWFAFMHLSLQEYFAACYLEPRLTASRFSSESQRVAPTDAQLKTWANDPAWREAFVLLFEILSGQSKSESEGFLSHLFDQRLENDVLGREETAAGLLAELAINPFVLLTEERRKKSRQQVWRWVIRRGALQKDTEIDFLFGHNEVVKSLLRGANGDLNSAWKSASLTKQELANVISLDLSGCTTLTDLTPLRRLIKLESLALTGCTKIADISPLEELKGLRKLSLTNCESISDLTPLKSLKNLEKLEIEECGDEKNIIGIIGYLQKLTTLFTVEPVDAAILAGLKNLREVHLHTTLSDYDLSPLAQCKNLQQICTDADGTFTIDSSLRRNTNRISSAGVKYLWRDRMR